MQKHRPRPRCPDDEGVLTIEDGARFETNLAVCEQEVWLRDADGASDQLAIQVLLHVFGNPDDRFSYDYEAVDLVAEFGWQVEKAELAARDGGMVLLPHDAIRIADSL